MEKRIGMYMYLYTNIFLMSIESKFMRDTIISTTLLSHLTISWFMLNENVKRKASIFYSYYSKKKFESFLLTFCLTQLLIRIKLTRGDNGVYFSHDVKNIVPNLLVFSHIRVKIYILSCTYTDWKEWYSYFFSLFFHMKTETFLTQPSSWVMEIILVYQNFF